MADVDTAVDVPATEEVDQQQVEAQEEYAAPAVEYEEQLDISNKRKFDDEEEDPEDGPMRKKPNFDAPAENVGISFVVNSVLCLTTH